LALKIDIPGSTMVMETPQKGLSRAREVFRKEGVRAFFFKLVGEFFYRRLILFERSTSEPVRKMPLGQFLSFSILDEDGLEEYRAFRPDTSIAEIKQRLAEGQLCFVLRAKRRIVHTTWAMTDRAYIDYLSYDFRLRQDVAYVYDSFSLPDYRGRGIPLIRLAHMLPHLSAIGYRRVISANLPENKAGMRPPLKAGYHHYGIIGYIGLGKWRRYFCRVKKVHGLPLIYIKRTGEM